MLRGLYDWTLSLAARKSAEWWLAIIAFIESSFFFVPADVLYLPMALARPDRAYRYALTATVASVLGGIAGWMIGYFAYDTIARPILEHFGGLETFERWQNSGIGLMLVLLVTSGLAHLPPIKVGHHPCGRPARQFVDLHHLGHRRSRRPLPALGVAAAPLWRIDPRIHRKAPRADRWRRGRCPDFALYRRQIRVLVHVAQKCPAVLGQRHG